MTNVSGLHQRFRGSIGGPINDLGSPVGAKGVVYVGSPDGNLYAFDAKGNTNCAGDPASCMPLWTAATDYFVLRRHLHTAVHRGERRRRHLIAGSGQRGGLQRPVRL